MQRLFLLQRPGARRPLRRPSLWLVAGFALAACQPLPPEEDVPPLAPDAPQYQVVIERAYTLQDSRYPEFRDQIRSEGAGVCGGPATALTIRPFGPERFDDQFIYRMHEVTFACR